jgi:hypothetical protein
MDLTKLELAINKAKNLELLELAKDAVKNAADAERAKLEAERAKIDAKLGYINKNEKNLLDLAEINRHGLIPMPTVDDMK